MAAAFAADWLLCSNRRGFRIVAIGLLFTAVIEPVGSYPTMTGFFNVLAGGREGGSRYVIEFNIDFGQDYIRLRDWRDEHPEHRPLRVRGMGFLPASTLGLGPLFPGQIETISTGSIAISRHEIFCREEYRPYRAVAPIGTVGSFLIFEPLHIDD